jgi:hypothetical protein
MLLLVIVLLLLLAFVVEPITSAIMSTSRSGG